MTILIAIATILLLKLVNAGQMEYVWRRRESHRESKLTPPTAHSNGSTLASGSAGSRRPQR